MARFTKEYLTLGLENLTDVLRNPLIRSGDVGKKVQDDESEKSGKKTLIGKPEWCLVPMEAMEGVVRVFESGYVTYGGTRTWLPGIRFSLLFSAMCRHLFGWFYKGHDKDEKSGEHPLCHVIANALMLLTFVDKPKFDDRPGTPRHVASREEIYAKLVDDASIRNKEGGKK